MHNIPKLSDRALLVKLTIKRAAMTKRDAALTSKIQAQEGDQSLTVLTKLFRDKASPVNQIMAAVNEIYAYHRKHTLPYVDAGPRILPSDNYFDYTRDMKHLIGQEENLLQRYMPYYDQLVLDDCAYRNSGHAAGRATPADYPTAEQFERSMSVEYRFSPMPDARHFLFDLSDDDMKAFEEAEVEAAQVAATDAVTRMLKPLQSLVARLGEYQGQKGERFHNSLIQNVIEGCDLAEKLTLNPTPEMLAQIEAVRKEAKGCLEDVESIKGSHHARQVAQAKLAAIADKMSMFG
jgi:hypothetical protein